MNITWITRSFLDYRVPVYDELNRLVDSNLTLVYFHDVVPLRVVQKVTQVLDQKSIGLSGELRLAGPKSYRELEKKRKHGGRFANKGLRIPYQPGLIFQALKSEPDVVISDGFFQWTYAALWLRATRHIPHVMCYERTAHSERNAQWYRVTYRKIIMRWIDAICCSGQLCGQYVQSLGFSHNRITYGHMVADVEGLRRAVSGTSGTQISNLTVKLSLKGLVFLYVGRLISLKGIRGLLDAWKVFSCDMMCEATLLLVGDGSQRSELEQYCKKNRLVNVRFTGAVDYDELALFYSAASAFIIPTLEDNWSLVVPEAMAAGLPILCSKYNGCWPEYVTPANGWVFDPLNLDNTVDCLRRCLLARERLPEMGRESNRIVSDYTARHAAKAILRASEIAIARQKNK